MRAFIHVDATLCGPPRVEPGPDGQLAVLFDFPSRMAPLSSLRVDVRPEQLADLVRLVDAQRAPAAAR